MTEQLNRGTGGGGLDTSEDMSDGDWSDSWYQYQEPTSVEDTDGDMQVDNAGNDVTTEPKDNGLSPVMLAAIAIAVLVMMR